MTAARTRFAREWLAYGRLERPPIIDCPTIEIDHGLAEGGWLRSLIFPAKQAKPRQPATPSEDGNWSVEEWIASMQQIPSVATRGSTITVPAVLAQAYTLEKGLGILLINLRQAEPMVVRVPIRPADYGLARGEYGLTIVQADSQRAAGAAQENHTAQVELPAREFVLLEVRPQ